MSDSGTLLKYWQSLLERAKREEQFGMVTIAEQKIELLRKQIDESTRIFLAT